jgi:hypothetical protein
MHLQVQCTRSISQPVMSRPPRAHHVLRLNPCVSTHALATLSGTRSKTPAGRAGTHTIDDSYRFSKLRLRHTRTIISSSHRGSGATLPVQRPGLPRCLCTFGLAGTLSDVELRFFVSGHVRLINLAGAECEFVRVVNRSEHSTTVRPTQHAAIEDDAATYNVQPTRLRPFVVK